MAHITRKQLIDLVWDRYKFSGNPYNCDDGEAGIHTGEVNVCDDILLLLGMEWNDVKAIKAAEIRKSFADQGLTVGDSLERYLTSSF